MVSSLGAGWHLLIVTALEENGLTQNTWLIFTVDHGLAMPRAKGTLYDSGLGVALIMHWPAAGISGGRRYAQLVSHVDLVPTLLEGIGLPLPGNLRGKLVGLKMGHRFSQIISPSVSHSFLPYDQG
jgi:arylsulfatase A-like enzyme